MPKLESSTERDFRDWCKSIGLKARKLRDVGEEGFPDRSIILPGGILVCIEFKKAKTGRLRPSQVRRIAELRALGVPVLVTSSLQEAKQWLLDRM